MLLIEFIWKTSHNIPLFIRIEIENEILLDEFPSSLFSLSYSVVLGLRKDEIHISVCFSLFLWEELPAGYNMGWSN